MRPVAAPRPFWLRAYRAYRRAALPVPFLVRRFIARHGSRAGPLPRLCIDIAAGTSPYRECMTRHLGVDRHVALELAASDTTDVVSDARRLPFRDRSADLVVCFEGMQHIPDSSRALDEMVRVLRPGGHVILSFPFLYGECDVRDLYRWSLSGMSHELGRRGLTVLAAESRGGALFALASLVHWSLQHLVPGGRRSWRAERSPGGRVRAAVMLLLTAPAVGLQWAALALDSLLPRMGLYAGGLVMARSDDEGRRTWTGSNR